MNLSYWTIQSIAALALVAAYWQGWIDDYVLYDRTGISQAIVGLGVAGSVFMFFAWRSKWGYESHIGVVKTLGSYSVNLGLLGTLIGFMVALSGIVTVAGAAEMKAMVGSLVDGMTIAIGTSIVGCIVALFLSVHRLVFSLSIEEEPDGE